MRYKDFKIAEANIPDNERNEKYIPAINDALSSNKPLSIEPKGGEFKNQVLPFVPNQGQQIKTLSDPLTGIVKLPSGEEKEYTMAAYNLHKSAEIKAAQSGKAPEERIANKGEIVEGIYGAATMARLVNRPNADITPQDVYNVIARLPDTPQGGSVVINAEESNSDITDNFELVVKLKPQPYADLKNTSKIESMMGKTVRSVVAFVNNETIPRYAKLFAENQRPDSVDIISDGISDETGTKTDVKLIYKDENGQPVRDLIKYGQSVKVGAVKQFGQVGGGKASDSLERRFEKLEYMWEKFGIDVTPLKDMFVRSNRIEDAYEKVYDEAALMLKKELASSNNDNEKAWLKKFINGVKFFATLNDDNVNLIQFDNNGYFVLDFKRLDKLLDMGLDFDVMVQKGAVKNDPSIKLPKISIVDNKTGKKFLTWRMYRDGKGYIRNYIEKEDGLKQITMARKGKAAK
mgnify:CR=1 FL=1